MPDLGAYDEPVRLDWDGARDLAAELRGTASLLEDQDRQRGDLARRVRQDWLGGYAEQFDERASTCGRDAHRFREALRAAAQLVDDLVHDAAAERDRRQLAQDWVRRQDQESWYNRNVSDRIWGEDDPPPDEPNDPPRLSVEAPPLPVERGPGVQP